MALSRQETLLFLLKPRNTPCSMTIKIETVSVSGEDSQSYNERKRKMDPIGTLKREPSVIWAILCGIGILLFAAAAIYYHFYIVVPDISNYQQNKVSAFWSRLIFCFLLGLTIWFLINLVISYLMISISRRGNGKGFLRVMLMKDGWFMSIVFTLLLLSAAIGIYDKGIENKLKKPNASVDDLLIATDERKSNILIASPTLSTFLMENLANVLFAISVFLGTLLAKTILVHGLNFKMLFKSYEERIRRHDEDLQIIEVLDRATGKKTSGDAEQWAGAIFRTISPEKNFIDLRELEYFFGVSNARRVLDRFDIGKDGQLEFDEFVSVYQEIINEGKRIEMGMEQKMSTVRKLDMVLCFVLIPTGVFIAATIMGTTESLTKSIPFQFSTFLSFSFVFAPILADLFKSIVFIFFVEAFDVGDKVLIEDVLHEVRDIGLLYTSFVVSKKMVVVQNVKIMDKPIVNLREARISQRVYEFIFSNTLIFKTKMDDLRNEIKAVIDAFPKIYTGNFYIGEYILRKDSSIRVKIGITFRINNQNVDALHAREDAFTIILHDIFNNLGLIIN